jgi:hypothetical protein
MRPFRSVVCLQAVFLSSVSSSPSCSSVMAQLWRTITNCQK